MSADECSENDAWLPTIDPEPPSPPLSNLEYWKPHQEFQREMWSNLMSSIRKLLLTSVLALSVCPAIALSATTLNQDQIAQEIIGKTLNAKRMGLAVRIVYKADGTVAVVFPLISGSGTWSFDGDAICMNLDSGPRRGKTCVTFEKLDGNKFRNSEGVILTVEDQQFR